MEPQPVGAALGRIHRYGQTREVSIFNLVAGDTREGRVMKRLFDKLDEIRAALGSDKVFDVLGDVLYGKNLAQLLLEAAANARLDEILQELEIRVDETYLTRVRAALDESLATHFIDYTRMQQLADRAREYRLIPEYTEAFFKRAWEATGGQVHTRKDGFLTVESVPYAVRQLAEEKPFQQRFGPLQRRYTQITFDKDLAFRHAEAEFVSFGHPLFEAVLAWVDRECAAAVQRGATFTDPDGQLDGLLLFYEGEIRDGLGQLAGCRLFALYAERATGAMRAVAPTLLWDLAESGDASGQPCDVEAARQQALHALLPALEQYRAELQAERDRQAGIKQKYGAASLDHLILRLDGELIDLYARRDCGENVDLPIRNKEEQKRRYELALAKLRQTVIQESSLTLCNGLPLLAGSD